MLGHNMIYHFSCFPQNVLMTCIKLMNTYSKSQGTDLKNPYLAAAHRAYLSLLENVISHMSCAASACHPKLLFAAQLVSVLHLQTFSVTIKRPAYVMAFSELSPPIKLKIPPKFRFSCSITTALLLPQMEMKLKCDFKNGKENA